MPRTGLPSRSPRPGLRSWLAGWCLAVVLVMLFVWQKASVDRLMVELEGEEARHRDLETQVNALRLEASRLSSLGQVEGRAARELGLRRPAPEEIVAIQFAFPPEDAPFEISPFIGEANAEPSEKAGPR